MTQPTSDPKSTATSAAKDSTNDESTGLRARYRALRNDADVQETVAQTKPFLTGAAFVGGMLVDPALTVAVTTLRVGRAIQKHNEDKRITGRI